MAKQAFFDPASEAKLPLADQVATWLPRQGREAEETVTLRLSAATAMAVLILTRPLDYGPDEIERHVLSRFRYEIGRAIHEGERTEDPTGHRALPWDS